jgi:hypothetical protein
MAMLDIPSLSALVVALPLLGAIERIGKPVEDRPGEGYVEISRLVPYFNSLI